MRLSLVARVALGLALAYAVVPPSGLQAQTMATDSATVQVMGPIPPDNGKIFIDVIGRDNVAQASGPSYSVIEFSAGGLGFFSEVDSLTVTLTQSLFAASSRGIMLFAITDDTTTSIQSVDSPLIFDVSDVNGLNGQLSNVYVLGHGEFDIVRNGTVDSFTFPVDPASALETYLLNQIATGGTIRLIVAPDMDDQDDDLVGGSYGGAFNANPAFVPTLAATGQ